MLFLTGDSLLALGFCSEAKEVRGMPGSLHQSWGFYGDSGHLLARGAPTGEDKSIDLGYVQSFGAGDIVGVGWSSVTGEALCTRNGERLRLGECCTSRQRKLRILIQMLI